MTALSVSPPTGHPFHPFRTTQAYNRPSQPTRTTYIPRSSSSPPSPRPSHFYTSIPPEIPAPPRVLRKAPSNSAIQPMPTLPLKNRQRAPTLPAPEVRRNPYGEHGAGESYLPFEPPPSSNWIDRRTRKRSQGFFSPPLSPISTAHISAPSATVRLSSDPTKASAQLGFHHGYPITPPDLPSIHGVFDKFDAGPPRPISSDRSSQPSHKLSSKKPPPIDTAQAARKSRRDTLKLPMMDPTDRSATRSTQPSPNSSSGATPTDIDMSEWDLVSMKSIRPTPPSRPSSRITKADPSPVPTYANFAEWVDPETQLSPGSGKQYSPTELDLRAIEVLEHFSGHLLKDGWGDELERYRPNPKSAPAVPAKSKLRNDQSRTLPQPASGEAMGYSEWGHRSRKEDLDAGSMRSWREARKRSKPPALRPLSEQPPVGSNQIQGGRPPPPTPHIPQRPTSPTPPLRSTSLAPGLSVTRPSFDEREIHEDTDTGPKGSSGMRRVSSALSRMSSEEKRRPKVNMPLMLDTKVKGQWGVLKSPTSPVPIQHRPLPPLPGIPRNTPGPSRSNSAGPAGLLQLKFQRGLLRPKRPGTASIAEDHYQQNRQIHKLAARDEPHSGSPLSPRPDASEKRDRRKGMTALSFLAMEDPYTTERSTDHGATRPSLDGGNGPVVVEHILPPEELSKIVSESSARRGSWSSSDSNDGHGIPDASSLDRLVEESATEANTDLQSPMTSPTVRKSVSMERSKSKKKMEYRKSSGQASLSMSLCLPETSPFSPLSPASPFDADDLPARPTALPPPPRPRYSLTNRKDPVGSRPSPHGFLSTPPLPDPTPPNSARVTERPQTFMALSSAAASPISRFSPLPTRPTSPFSPSPPVSPTSPVRQFYSPVHGPMPLSPTPEPSEPGNSPVTSIFGLRRYSGADSFGMAPTPTPGSGPGTSLVRSIQSRPIREDVDKGPTLGGGNDDHNSISTTNTSRRDAEREERERALREWLRMKPRRGTKDGGASPGDVRGTSPASP